MDGWMDESRREEQTDPAPSLPLYSLQSMDGDARTDLLRPSACSTPSTPTIKGVSSLFTVHCSSTKKRDMSLQNKRSMSEGKRDSGPTGVWHSLAYDAPSPRKTGGSAKMAKGPVDKECAASSKVRGIHRDRGLNARR